MVAQKVEFITAGSAPNAKSTMRCGKAIPVTSGDD
jgi:hypothetical protein